MIKTILVDLDDVLNSFTMYSLGQMGCDVTAYEYGKYPRECGYDIVRAFNTLSGEDLSVEGFWECLPPDVWHSAPMSQEAPYILEWAFREVGRENVFIATKPTLCPYSASGKVRWMQKNLPEIHRQYVITAYKHLMANPETLLIDDSETNVMKFVAKGGRAMLMPRPWNTAYPKDLRLPL